MAASMLRLRAAAAGGGFRQFSSSAACLMLPSNKMYSLGEKKIVNIDSSKNEKEFESDYVVGSSHGWVGLMKEEEDRVRCGSSSSLSLWNPMSGSRVKLPPLHTIPHHPKCRLAVESLMVDDAECGRAIIVGFSNWLGVCCPGRCSEWTLFGHKEQYEAVMAWQSKVYSVNINRELVRWNVNDPRRPERAWEKDLRELGYKDDEEDFPRRPDLFCYTYLHLVYAVHTGDVFLVTRHFVEGMDPHNYGIYPKKTTVAFDVHQLVENRRGNGKELCYMKHSLDGLVMFVGLNNSFAVAAADFPHLNPDSIYFTCQSHSHWGDDIYGGDDVGIYDYKNRTIHLLPAPVTLPVYYPSQSNHQRFKRIHPHPFWFTPTSMG